MPSIEAGRGRARVEGNIVATARGAVAMMIQEHVSERVAHLARRLEGAGVEAGGEEAAAAAEVPVEVPREAHTETGDAAREALRVVGLDEEVQVVRLHGVVDEAKAIALRASREALLDDAEGRLLP
ncbi:MAG TPA: hypothetical protein VFX50_01115 [Gemmatimonadales bacterium]|nr:hypothetical protein [Gemmatimonadales bacterium]